MRSKASLLLLKFYDQLLSQFGKQHWWPGDSPWEVAVGAVLTQNTNWNNVEKAIDNLKVAEALSVKKIHNLETAKIAELIRPSGYYNLKAKRLKNLAGWWIKNSSSAFDLSTELDEIRHRLLGVNGIGEETADSILLYAFNRCTFVIDAYTKRFLLRHKLMPLSTHSGDPTESGVIHPGGNEVEPRDLTFPRSNDIRVTYNEMKSYFEENLPPDIELYKEYHALIVMLGKHYCKTKPICDECPLSWHLG